MLPSVAWLCPTYKRADKHALLASVFASQDYKGPLMLLVLDDSPEGPSPFFTSINDPRVIYTHHSGPRISIGTKRNMLCEQARTIGADVVVSADDDDLYAPRYTRVTVDELRGYDLVKLSVWDIRRDADGSIWRWDTNDPGGVHCVVSGSDPVVCAESADTDHQKEARDFARLGYGFSYVMRRALCDRVKFPDMDRGEDYAFMRAAIDAGAKIKFIADQPDIVLHAVHTASTSRSFPQWRLDAPTPPTKTFSPVGGKLTFESGKRYVVKAFVNSEHALAELKMRAGAFGLTVIDATDNVVPDTAHGWPSDLKSRDGYRYIEATVQATRDGSLPSAVPPPLSWFDASCVIAVSVVG